MINFLLQRKFYKLITYKTNNNFNIINIASEASSYNFILDTVLKTNSNKKYSC